MNWPWSRKMGTVVLLTIPLWWQGLHAWANSQRGYLEVDQVGASPFLWLALVGLAGFLLVVGAVPRRLPSGNSVALVIFLFAAGALALVNVAAGLPDGISVPGILLAAFSVAQVLVAVALAMPQQRRRMTDSSESPSP